MRSPTHAPAYVSLYPMLTEIAVEHGYTLCVHGSIVSDFDLVAVPWVEDAQPAEYLAHAIADYVSLINGANHDLRGIDGPEHKPHGRKAWSIPMGNGSVIDISITPRLVGGY